MNKQPAKNLPSGRIYLLIATIIIGAANAVTRKLTQLGSENLVNGHNPVSFCNVLFVGNLCALILISLIYSGQWRKSVFKQITPKGWLSLTVVAVLGSALVPTLIFSALAITAVNNVILISQITTPLILGLSVVFLKEKLNFWVILGAVIAFCGVTLTVLLKPPETNAVPMMHVSVGRGELMTLIASVFSAIANVTSKASLKNIPLGVFSGFRMLIGTIVFFAAASALFGPSHFTDLASPFLWKWMLLYSAVIVVGGQLVWLKGLKQSSASEVSWAAAFNPIAGIVAAFLILGEAPTTAQYIGGAVIFIGIVCNQIGVNKLKESEAIAVNQPEMDGKINFKGI